MQRTFPAAWKLPGSDRHDDGRGLGAGRWWDDNDACTRHVGNIDLQRTFS